MKASQQYLDGIIAKATILRDEAAVFKTEGNDIKVKADATIVHLQQKQHGVGVRKKRDAASVSSKRQRDRHAVAVRLADEEAQAALKLEQNAWGGNKSELEKRLRLSHTESSALT